MIAVLGSMAVGLILSAVCNRMFSVAAAEYRRTGLDRDGHFMIGFLVMAVVCLAFSLICGIVILAA